MVMQTVDTRPFSTYKRTWGRGKDSPTQCYMYQDVVMVVITMENFSTHFVHANMISDSDKMGVVSIRWVWL